MIIGRNLTIEEVLKLEVGTKVWCEETEYWVSCGFESFLGVIRDDGIIKDNKRAYSLDCKLFTRETGLKAIKEVCDTDDMRVITTEEAKQLENGTKVFVQDDSYTCKPNQWTVKNEVGLFLNDGTKYNFSHFNGNSYGRFGRKVTLYVDKNVEIETSEFKIGDRVVCLGDVMDYNTFCKTGTIVSLRKNGGILGVEFDEYVNSKHSLCGKGKYGYCAAVAKSKLQILKTVKFDLPLKRDKLPEKEGFFIGQRVENIVLGKGTIIDFTKGARDFIGVAFDNECTGRVTIGENKNCIKYNGRWLTPHQIVGYEPVVDKKEEKTEEKEIERVEFKVGDRVEFVSEKPYDTKELKGKIGTVVNTGCLIGVEFDEYIDGHSCDINAKYGYGWNVPKETLKKLSTLKEELQKSIFITQKGNKITATFDGESAIARCNPSDEFVYEIGVALALERLSEKLKVIGESKLTPPEPEIPIMTSDDFANFIKGEKVAIVVETEELSEKFLSMVAPLGKNYQFIFNVWKIHKEKTAYCFNYTRCNKIGFSSVDSFQEDGYRVVKFQ